MPKQEDLTPQEQKLVRECNIGQINSKFDCETCPHKNNCTDFLLKYECIPIQIIHSSLYESYIEDP